MDSFPVRGFLSLLLALCGAQLMTTAAEKKIYKPADQAPLDLPFSAAVEADGLVYIAGAGPLDEKGQLVAGDIKVQTRATLEYLRRVLKAAGLGFSQVVSANVYLADSRHFQAMNQVYREYFPQDPPARATVEADLVLPGMLVEIGLVAARPDLQRQAITPAGWPQPPSPYSYGVKAGNTLFLAGAIPVDPKTGKVVGATIQEQTRQTLRNLGEVLKAAGMGFEDVVSSRVYLTDARHFSGMNEAYREFFPQDPPARATTRARLMSPELLVEIQMVAVKGNEPKRVVAPAGRPRSTSPLSPAIAVGNRLYISGLTGNTPQGYARGDLKAQTRQTLENIRAILKEAGMDFSNVVDSMVWLTDVRHFQAMNEIYGEFFAKDPPARTTVGSGLMGTDAMVEIMMIAVK